MKVKKFTGSTMQEAMSQVKREMGSNAVILQTRNLQSTFLGLFPKRRVEITAANDVSGQDDNSRSESRLERQAEPPAVKKASMAPAWQEDMTAKRLISLEDKIAKLTSTVEVLVQKGLGGDSIQGPWSQVYQKLLLLGIEDALARGLVEELTHEGVTPEEILNEGRPLVEYIERVIKAEGAIRPPKEGQRISVLIGPTGVGKTTTLAKIAAEFLREGRNIAFITADTYRLAAVEQLQKYADIMGLCLETVYTPDELVESIGRHSDKEMIFVDTAGRSQRNNGQMEELRTFVDACQPAEVHLLLAATTKREDLEEIIDRFSICPIDRLILTKVDESTCFGPFYSVARRTAIPFSYLTTGQNVPEDMEEASREKIARLICCGSLEACEEMMEEEKASEEEMEPIPFMSLSADSPHGGMTDAEQPVRKTGE